MHLLIAHNIVFRLSLKSNISKLIHIISMIFGHRIDKNTLLVMALNDLMVGLRMSAVRWILKKVKDCGVLIA